MKNQLPPLDREQKEALALLAKKLGMKHVKDGIHLYQGSEYAPTWTGWDLVMKFNWKQHYRELERSYEDLQMMLDEKQKENKELRQLITVGDMSGMDKVWRIAKSHVDDKEKVRQITRYLMDKKE